MKVVVFKGGLGNQMFQYVFYNYLKNRNVRNIYGYYGRKELGDHNGLEIKNVFKNIELPKSSFFSNSIIFFYKLLNKILGKNKKTKFDHFDVDNIVYDGYWHDFKFFSEYTNKLFNFKITLDSLNQKNLNIIRQKKSVSVHIRRGDYLSSTNIYGNICTKEYYDKAISYFISNDPGSFFVFFSDDMEWVKQNFEMENAIYINNNSGDKSFIDLYLMSECKNNIIANSTFSWWGAYLNQNQSKTVIMPTRWYNTEVNIFNLFCEDWLKF
jgi:hypothetical protein